MRRRPSFLLASLVLAFAGCGGTGNERESALVDASVNPPINSLAIDPAGDGLLLTTNRGFFRIEDGRASRVNSRARTPDGTTPVGTFLAVAPHGRSLIGSGHPDRIGKFADFLGVMRSTDGGRTWRIISRYSLADLHVIHPREEAIYAFDAVLGSLLVSEDGGRRWQERRGPPEQVVDFVVDPGDPDHVLASTEKEIFRSTDGGKSWSATAVAESARMAWPDPETLRRADAGGIVYASSNGGSSWEPIEHLDGEPHKLLAEDPQSLYLALADATILSSTDGGETWREHFRP